MVKVHINPKVLACFLVGLVLFGGLAFGVVRFRQLQIEVQKLKTNPQALQDAAKADVKKLVDQVAKLIAVPRDETPTVATVSDSEKLKSNAFFINSKNGDKVLIFSNAKKAILYRPGENKIIEVGPVSIGTPSATVVAQIKLVLYNGTNVTGLTKSYETKLKTKIPAAVITDRDNAAKRDYATTILVDLGKNKATETAVLAQSLGIQVAPLPDGETAPTGADFLIIVGADKQ